MDRVDYFFRQIVTEAELDEGFAKCEAGDQKIMSDQLLTGIFVGGEVAEHFAVPDLTVDIAGPCVAYDQAGQRMFFSPLQVLDMSIDENGVTTAVGTPGNEKTLSIFLEFDRSLSDPRLDGNSVTVFYQRTESFKLNVVQGAELVIPTSVPPPLRVDQILLADVTIINAQVAILDADIDDSRREDVYELTGSPNALKAGRTQDVLQAFLDIINAGGVAATTSYAGGSNWLDGTTNPATNVEAQLDKIITDLIANAGADRIATAGGAAGAMGSAGDSIQDLIDDAERGIQTVFSAVALALANGVSVALNSVGSTNAWAFSDFNSSDMALPTAPANSEVLILEITPAPDQYRITNVRVDGSNGGGLITLNLVRYFNITGRNVEDTITSTLDLFGNLSLTGLTVDHAPTSSRHVIELFTDGTAGNRQISLVAVQMTRVVI